MSSPVDQLEDNPTWYKDAIIYELHVKSFFDSNDDGVGDFKGLIQKLDYLESLGITAIWLLPFYPSPLRDDGYDIADYYNIHKDYGTLRDFRRFLREAHKRGMRVITELVVNHTSDQHAWFQRSRKAKPGTIWRDYYVWSDTPNQYSETRIIFKDFEASNWTWDPVANAYYWHRFYSHQPDLNFDNERVQKEILKVLDFWFEMGVDGLRLDAIPYLYEREGTNCENLPETHEFLKKLRAHVDSKFKNRMLLAEANQWPEDAAAYFGDGDECHMAFHFPVMPRLFMALRMEDRFPIVDILEQTPDIPESNQWAMFLRNHDELTLEMVTDEERDYMYRIFAQDPRARINLGIRRRLAPLLDNNRKKIELMNILLFSLPGTPVMYYGDEIGMGDNYYLGDRDGVRTPMQWSADRNAGFSRANPQSLFLPAIIDPEYHFESLNVENQERNPSSQLWWMKRVMAMRKHFRAFSRGTLDFIFPDNPKVLVFTREHEEETVLVVINLSRFTQCVDIDLSEFAGYVPTEVFSQNQFPTIREEPYFLTLGPYGHYWLLLEKEEEYQRFGEESEIPTLQVKKKWTTVFQAAARQKLEKNVLPDYLRACRWFGGKARTIRKITIKENFPVPMNGDEAYLLLLDVQYTVGAAETYLLPVAYNSETAVDTMMQKFPQSVISRLQTDQAEGFLFDAIYAENFRQSLLALIAKRKKLKGKSSELVATQGKRFRGLAKELEDGASRVLKTEQSNSSVLYEDVFFLKLYRRVEEGMNPDPEMVQFLTEVKNLICVPPFAGTLEYREQNGSEPRVLTLLQGLVPNEGDAWTTTISAVGRYYERVLSQDIGDPEVDISSSTIFDIDFDTLPPSLQDLMGAVYLEQAELLGQRTGEMHLALASTDHPDFKPEPFSTLYQRSLYQSLRSNIKRGLNSLSRNRRHMADTLLEDANTVLALEKNILSQVKKVMQKKMTGLKIRIHGDYHLGQVLYTGRDFIIIDFEGEPAKPPSERRLKFSALRDVAGMIRSLHYAAYSTLFQQTAVRPEDAPRLTPWADVWHHYVSGIFLSSYLKTVDEAPFVPTEREHLEILLQSFLLDKVIYELIYEINNRPDWVTIPLKAIGHIVQTEE